MCVCGQSLKQMHVLNTMYRRVSPILLHFGISQKQGGHSKGAKLVNLKVPWRNSSNPFVVHSQLVTLIAHHFTQVSGMENFSSKKGLLLSRLWWKHTCFIKHKVQKNGFPMVQYVMNIGKVIEFLVAHLFH